MGKRVDKGFMAEFEAFSTVSDRHRYSARLLWKDGKFIIQVGSRSNSPIWIQDCNSTLPEDALQEYLNYCRSGGGVAWIPLTDKLRIGHRYYAGLEALDN